MKKTIYLILSIFLGIIISFGLHALIEMWYLSWAEDTGREVTWTSFLGIGSCALPLYVSIGLFVLGAVGGYFLGRWWWRVIYIEGRRWFTFLDSKKSN